MSVMSQQFKVLDTRSYSQSLLDPISPLNICILNVPQHLPWVSSCCCAKDASTFGTPDLYEVRRLERDSFASGNHQERSSSFPAMALICDLLNPRCRGRIVMNSNWPRVKDKSFPIELSRKALVKLGLTWQPAGCCQSCFTTDLDHSWNELASRSVLSLEVV